MKAEDEIAENSNLLLVKWVFIAILNPTQSSSSRAERCVV